MAKKRTPEQEAIRVAQRRPERKWFVSRRLCWVFRQHWGFSIDWSGFSLSIGPIEGTDHPKSVFLVHLGWRPFAFDIFWRSECIVWIGDWEWKKGLRRPSSE